MISLSRINPADVVHAHLLTLRELGKKGINYGDIFFFFGLPAVAAIPLAYFFSDKLHKQDTDLLTAVSIIGGFLFGLLGMTAQIVEKVKKDSEEQGINNIVKRLYAKEIHSNVAFGIIMALACVVTLVSFGFMDTPTTREYSIGAIVAGVNYFLLLSFLFTLLMIVKRLFVILSIDAEDL